MRVLDAKKQVLEAYRSRKHSLQHAYAPKFAIFHGENGQKYPFFGQKMSFSASDKQLKTPPPILRVLDAKKDVIWTHGAFKHSLQYAELLKRVVFLMLQVLGFLDVIKSYVMGHGHRIIHMRLQW